MATTATSSGTATRAPSRRARVTKAQQRQLTTSVIAERQIGKIEVSPVILTVNPKQSISQLFEWGPEWEEGRWVLEERYSLSGPRTLRAVRVRFDASVRLRDFIEVNVPLHDALKGIAPKTLADHSRIADALADVKPPQSIESAVSDQLRVILKEQA